MNSKMPRLCKICGQPIHPERLAVSPRTLTDTAKCAAENTRLLRNAANRRWQKAKREQSARESALEKPQ